MLTVNRFDTDVIVFFVSDITDVIQTLTANLCATWFMPVGLI